MAASAAAPADGVAQVVWVVSSASPSYLYAFGTGESTTADFDIVFHDQPPQDAFNQSGVAVGFPVLLPSGGGLPDGRVDAAAVSSAALGASQVFGVVYKTPLAAGPAWIDSFPEGYSCARGVLSASGDAFDSFEPAACSEVTISSSPVALLGARW